MQLIISYAPLFQHKLISSKQITTDNDPIQGELLEKFNNSASGYVNGILWINGEDRVPFPILVMDRAKEIFEHIIEWSEGSPASWFNLIMDEIGGQYALALFPNLDKTIDRAIVLQELFHSKELPSENEFEILFKPIYFWNTDDNSVYKSLELELGDQTKVGFIDKSYLESTPMDKIETSEIMLMGPFKIQKDTAGQLSRFLAE